MSVHYKFKSSLDFDTFTFDGLHISVSDLKKAILQQKRLAKVTDCDLQITNAQTNEEYSDDSYLIPKNSSLIVARVPLSQPHKKLVAQQRLDQQQQVRPTLREETIGSDLTQMKGSEEEKILAMMLQSSADYDPKSYQRTKGISQTGDIPSTYRCNKCKKSGHWIKNCPYSVEKDFIEVRRNAGIPRSLRGNDANTLEVKPKDAVPYVKEKQEIPEELLCSLCNDIFTDAVMIPCCGSSFCDDCVRTALLESENNECPDCKEKGSSPGSLIPNRFLRNSVNAYKNETGYTSIPLKKDMQVHPSPDTNDSNKNDSNKSESTKNDSNKNDSNKSESNKNESNKNESNKNESNKNESNKNESNKNEPNKNEPNKNESNKNESNKVVEVVQKRRLSVSNEDTNDKTMEDEPADNKQTKIPKIMKDPGTAKMPDIESDYEDNIVVTMPPAQREMEQNDALNKPYNGRDLRQPKISGRDCSPRHHLQAPTTIKSDIAHNKLPEMKNPKWEPENNRYCEDRNSNSRLYNNAPYYKQSVPEPIPKPVNMYPPIDVQPHSMGPIGRHEMYPGPNQNMKAYQQTKQMCHPTQPLMRPFYNDFHEASHNMNMRYPHFVHPPYQNPNYGFPPMKKFMDDINQAPSPHLASVYEGVAAKVGNGIIDDPLEAFNRIMKEKEKYKERRSPEFRRSRSTESQPRLRFRSYDHKPTREISKKGWERSHATEKKRERHDKPSNRHRRLTPEKFSRSRSWSKSPHKMRSRSPNPKNPSQSRSTIFGNKYPQTDRRANNVSPRKKTRDTQHERSSMHRKPENSANLSKKPENKEPPPPGYEEGAYPYSRGNKTVQNFATNLYDKRDQSDNNLRQQEGGQNNFVFKVDSGNHVRSLTPTFKLSPHEREVRTRDETYMDIDLHKEKKRQNNVLDSDRTEKLSHVDEPKDSRQFQDFEEFHLERNTRSSSAENLENIGRLDEKAEQDIEKSTVATSKVLGETPTKAAIISPKSETKNKKLKERKKKKDKSERKKNKKVKKEKRSRGRERDKTKHKLPDVDRDNKNSETDLINNVRKLLESKNQHTDAEKTPLTSNEQHIKKNQTKGKSYSNDASDSKKAEIKILYKPSSSSAKSDNERSKFNRGSDRNQSEDDEYGKMKHFNTGTRKTSIDRAASPPRCEEQKNPFMLLKPELSRWERDDFNIASSRERQDDIFPKKGDIVGTSEMLLRNAESAIFSRTTHQSDQSDKAFSKMSSSKVDQNSFSSSRKNSKEREIDAEKKRRIKEDNPFAKRPSMRRNSEIKFRIESKIVNKVNSSSPNRTERTPRTQSKHHHSKERTSSQSNFNKNEKHSSKSSKQLQNNSSRSEREKKSVDMHSLKHETRKFEPKKSYDTNKNNKSGHENGANMSELKQTFERKDERRSEKSVFNEFKDGYSHKRSPRDDLASLQSKRRSANRSTVFSESDSERESSRSKKKKKPKYKKEKKRQRHTSSNESRMSEYGTQKSSNTKSEKQNTKNKF